MLSEAIGKMKRCQYRMMIDHPGTRKTHHGLYLFSHGRCVAMDLAIGARCFTFLERTSVETPSGKIQKLSTLIAKLPARFMHVVTIDTDHRPDSLFFPDHPAFFN